MLIGIIAKNKSLVSFLFTRDVVSLCIQYEFEYDEMIGQILTKYCLI